MDKKAYTLIELLLVIAIIGILATVGVYAWGASGKRSRDSVRKSDLSRMKNALSQHYLSLRSYPEFDSSAGEVFHAGWQLERDTACNHATEKKRFIAPTYISDIPQDPKTNLSYGSASCPELTLGRQHYLYITETKSSKNPREFMLLATLEASENDRVASTTNPVSPDYNGAKFIGYKSYSGDPHFYNANYLIQGNFGR